VENRKDINGDVRKKWEGIMKGEDKGARTRTVMQETLMQEGGEQGGRGWKKKKGKDRRDRKVNREGRYLHWRRRDGLCLTGEGKGIKRENEHIREEEESPC